MEAKNACPSPQLKPVHAQPLEKSRKKNEIRNTNEKSKWKRISKYKVLPTDLVRK
jgi:hypothetical protein